MYATPRNYIGSILAGENSVIELRQLASSRAQRLNKRVFSIGPARNDAQLAAIAWACEITALEAAADAMTERQVAWADFDAMLADMPAELGRVAEFFGFDANRSRLQSIAAGPLMTRYSKAMEYDYSASLRGELIAEASAANRTAIDGALAMLASAAEKSTVLARALERAGED
jgi:hypothetical protein